jgi:hypothetical protein
MGTEGMRPAGVVWLSLLLLAIGPTGCDKAPPPTARLAVTPGYAGPLPAPDVRRQLQSLNGATFLDAAGSFGGGEWTVISGFAVTPHYPLSSGGVKEPHATLVRRNIDPSRAAPEDLRHVRLSTDEDAQLFIGRVKGTLAQRGTTGR